jgi:hypothetical protein
MYCEPMSKKKLRKILEEELNYYINLMNKEKDDEK